MHFYMKRFAVGGAVMALLVSVCIGCHRPTGNRTEFDYQILGREYNVDIEGKGAFRHFGHSVIVVIGERQLSIEKERVLLDGKECATIRPETRRFRVVYDKQVLTVTADGATIYSGALPPEAAKPTPAPAAPPSAGKP